MGVGYMTAFVPKLSEPKAPDGFTLSGYEVQYDGPGDTSAEGKTIREAANRLEHEFAGCIRVYADCTEDGGSGEMTCEWDSRKNAWCEWEWK